MMRALAVAGNNKWPAITEVINKIFKSFSYILVNKRMNLFSKFIATKVAIN